MKKLLIPSLIFLLVIGMVFADDFTPTITSPAGMVPGSTPTTFIFDITNLGPNSIDNVTINTPGGFTLTSCQALAGWTLTQGVSTCTYDSAPTTILFPGNTAFTINSATTGAVTGSYGWNIQVNHLITGPMNKWILTDVDADLPIIKSTTMNATDVNNNVLVGAQLIDSNYLANGDVNIRVNVEQAGGSGFGAVNLYWRNDGVLATTGDTQIIMNDLTLAGNERTFNATLSGIDIADTNIANFIIQAYDGAGNELIDNNAGLGFEWTSDGTTPLPGIVTPPLAGIVYDTQPRMEIMWTEAGSGVDLFTTGMTLNGLPVVLSGNNLTNMHYIPAAPIPQGTYTIEVYGNDTVGNEGSLSWAFTIMEPILTSAILTSPPSGETVSGEVIVTAHVDGTDNINVVSVDFWNDIDGFVFSDLVAPYMYSWDTSLLVNSTTYNWYAIVTATTDTLTSSTSSVTIDHADKTYTQAETDALIAFTLDGYYMWNETYNMTQVDTYVANINLDVASLNSSLINYYMSNETYNKTEVDNYVTSLNSNLASLNASLVNYYLTNETYNQSQTDAFVASLQSNINSLNASLVNYYLTNETYNKTETDTLVATLSSDLISINNSLTNYRLNNESYSQVEVDALLNAINNSLINYYMTNETYNMTQVDNLISNIGSLIISLNNSFVDYYMWNETYNQSQTDAFVASLQSNINSLNASLVNYYLTNETYNKTEVDNYVTNINSDIISLNTSLVNYYMSNETYNMTQVDALIATANSYNMTNYYMSNETYNMTQVDNLVNALNASLVNYYMFNETYNQSQTDLFIAGVNADIASLNASLSQYYMMNETNSSAEIMNMVGGLYTQIISLNNSLSLYYKWNETYNVTQVDNYITGINSNIASVNNSLSQYYVSTDVYNKTEVDTFIGLLNTSLQNSINSNFTTLYTTMLTAMAGLIPPQITSINLAGTINDPTPLLNISTDTNSTCKLDRYDIDYNSMTYSLLPDAAGQSHTLSLNASEGVIDNVYHTVCRSTTTLSDSNSRLIAFNYDSTPNYNFTQTLFANWNWFYLPRFILEGDGSSTFPIVSNYSVESVLSSINGTYNYLAYKNTTDWMTYVPGRPVNDLLDFNDQEVKPYFVYINNTNGSSIQI